MKKIIRYEGGRKAFKHGRTPEGDFSLFYSERLNTAAVLDFIHTKGEVITDAEPARPVDLLPPDLAPRKGFELGMKANLIGPVGSHLGLLDDLENEFNPASISWQANYAGSLVEAPNIPLYVVVEGETAHLHSFLVTREYVQVGNIALINELNFALINTDPIKEANKLPTDYLMYLNEVTI